IIDLQTAGARRWTRTDLSHHGQDPAKLAQLSALEIAKMKTLRDFLGLLRTSLEAGETLLDRTTVFFSSNLADASKHSVKNMPVIVAGGPFQHGQHLAFDENKNPPPRPVRPTTSGIASRRRGPTSTRSAATRPSDSATGRSFSRRTTAGPGPAA